MRMRIAHWNEFIVAKAIELCILNLFHTTIYYYTYYAYDMYLDTNKVYVICIVWAPGRTFVI